jgi:hypothetical protein
MRISSRWITFVFGTLFMVGCGVSGVDDSDLGSAELEVSTVPTGVRCIHVKAKGTTTVTKSFSVTAATTVTLALGRVPLGDVVFEGTAYDVACPTNGTSAPSAQPTWVADPITMEVFAGAQITVPFVFRKYGNGSGTVDFVDPVAQISAGGNRSIALMLDGTVRHWGRDIALVPTPLAGLTDVIEVAAGNAHFCVIRSDRSLWCWGDNEYGQLGDGTRTSRTLPMQVAGLPAISHVSLGRYHSCAVAVDKRLFCWGQNFNYQVGMIEPTILYKTPEQITAIPYGFLEVAAGGQYTCALSELGRVYCWGANGAGQLGNGTLGGSLAPSGPVPYANAVVDIAAGDGQTCAARADGSVLCWGQNQPTATVVAGLADVVQVDGGGSFTCAILADGTGRCWGMNSSGQLGNGDGVDSNVPVVVHSLTDAVSVSGGGSHACAVAANGGATCWGGNYYGELGDGTMTNRFIPTPIEL